MIPHLLKLLLDKAEIFPSDCILKLVEKESTFTVEKFLDILIELAYGPIEVNQILRDESEALLEKIINSPICFEILRHLFELQKLQKISKGVVDYKKVVLDRIIRRITAKKDGLSHLIRTLMEMIGKERNAKVANTVAMCICQPPIDVSSHESHYQQLSAQIIDLLKIASINKIVETMENKEYNEYLRFGYNVALECIHFVARINKNYAQKFILDVILADLYFITDRDLLSKIDTSTIIVLESGRLLDTLTLISSLLGGLHQSKYVQHELQSFCGLWRMVGTASREGASPIGGRHTKVASEIAGRLVELAHVGGGAGDLVDRLLGLRDLDIDEREVHARLRVRPGLDGQSVDVVLADCDRDCSEDDKTHRWVLSEVAGTLPAAVRTEILGALFLRLLEARLAPEDDGRGAAVLAILCGEMQEHCFSKKADILAVAKATVCLYPSVATDTLETALSMTVLALEADGDLGDRERQILGEMMPSLQAVRLGHGDEAVRDLATEIAVVIATRGHVRLVVAPAAAVEEADEDDAGLRMGERLAGAVKEAEAADVPSRAHGLATIATMIADGDPDALAHSQRLLLLLSTALFHEDAFIYVRALRGLAALGTRFTARVLPLVAQRLRALRAPPHPLLAGTGLPRGASGDLGHFLKVSELLARIIDRLGETAPVYLDVTLRCLLGGLRDPEPLVRASCLASLAALVTQSDYLLAGCVHEVLEAVCGCLQTDREPQVRQAAARCLGSLLLGRARSPEGDLLARLPPAALSALMASLRRTVALETDQAVLETASGALASLDESVRLFLAPEEPRGAFLRL